MITKYPYPEFKGPSGSTPLAYNRIEANYPYTIEMAGRADFYPDWSSSSKKRKSKLRLKKTARAVWNNLEMLQTTAAEESHTEKVISEQNIA